MNLEFIKKAIKEIAEHLEIHPSKVRERDLLEYCPEITGHMLEKLGGINLIKKSFPLPEKDLKNITRQKQESSYISSLEKRVGEKEYLESEAVEFLKKNIKPIKVNSYKVKNKFTKTKKRDVVAMLNDTHYGLLVNPEEVGNVNEYNWKIAARRTAFFIDEVCKYKLDKRDEVGTLHFLINGDIIAGIIHGLTGRDLDLVTHQVNGAIHILTNAIKVLAENYKNVKVYYISGNHENYPHRREGHRVINQIYDSFGSVILYALSAAHKNTKNVKFKTTKTLYQDVDLPAGRAIMTHGDILFSKALGNPGSSINTKSLSDSIMRFNNGEVEKGKEPVKLILLGHTHAHMHITTNDGVQVYNAPSLSGVDSYAFSLGINHNLTAQLLFESTDQHIFGDSRLLHVSEADNNSAYDKIIPVYDYKLTWE